MALSKWRLFIGIGIFVIGVLCLVANINAVVAIICIAFGFLLALPQAVAKAVIERFGQRRSRL